VFTAGSSLLVVADGYELQRLSDSNLSIIRSN